MYLWRLAGESLQYSTTGIHSQTDNNTSPSCWSRIHAPRRESSQCPAHLASAQKSPLAPWPWLRVWLRSHGTAQNSLLLITQDREAGGKEEGRRWRGEKLAFKEWGKSMWTVKHGSPPTVRRVRWTTWGWDRDTHENYWFIYKYQTHEVSWPLQLLLTHMCPQVIRIKTLYYSCSL